MKNIIDRDFSSFGVPVHAPPYQSKHFWTRFDLAKLEIEVKKPEVIQAIVPRPLKLFKNYIDISINKVQDYRGTFAPYITGTNWFEIVIQIPTLYKNKFYLYCCEIFTNNFGIISVDREMFGFPKIPANIIIEQDGIEFFAKASHFNSNRDIIELSFKPVREGTVNDLGLKPRVVNFKNIPSPVVGESTTQVSQLIAIKYIKQRVHKIFIGKGDFKLKEWFPEYLKLAEIKGLNKAIYMDLELEIDGGRILFDYNKEKANSTQNH